MTSYYELIGVPASASTDEIHQAYVAKARRLHPDTLVGRSADVRERSARAMQALNEAWSVLRDPNRRRAYDRSLRQAEPVVRPAPPTGGPDPDWVPLDFDEPVAAFMVEDELRPSRASDLALLVPAALLGAGGLVFVFSMVMASTGLLAAAFLLALAGGVAFIISPFLVMVRQRSRG